MAQSRHAFAHTVKSVVREHAVLCVAFAAAAASALVVPPDAQYLSYFDVKTLACLFSILAIAAALRNAGALDAVASTAARRFSHCRSAVAALVGTTLALSMFITNDMALVVTLPISAAVLAKSGWKEAIPFTFIMQNLAANLGGMILPFGNPQNLYLYEHFHIAFMDFFYAMFPSFFVSCLLIALCCGFHRFHGKVNAIKENTRSAGAIERPLTRALSNAPSENARSVDETSINSQSEDGLEAVNGEGNRREFVIAIPNVATNHTKSANPDVATAGTESVKTQKTIACLALLVLVIAAVFRIIPWQAATIAVVATLAVIDRNALKSIDVGLLLTFACFFVFSGNTARIPTLGELLTLGMQNNPLVLSAGLSQVISNVPSAILLSNTTDAWQPLLVGVNIGGAGTPVASLASLITISQYKVVTRQACMTAPHRNATRQADTAAPVAEQTGAAAPVVGQVGIAVPRAGRTGTLSPTGKRVGTATPTGKRTRTTSLADKAQERNCMSEELLALAKFNDFSENLPSRAKFIALLTLYGFAFLVLLASVSLAVSVGL